MKEVRWHARAGQGAKTASQLLALAAVRAGKSVQAFPEYGPERRGAPIRAFTRIDDQPIRRRYAITEPDVVVVLNPSLLADPSVVEGLAGDGVLLVNSRRPAELVRSQLGIESPVVCVPAAQVASEGGSGFVNVVMLGAAAGVLREPPLEAVVSAVDEVLGAKLPEEARESAVAAVEQGYAAAQGEGAWTP